MFFPFTTRFSSTRKVSIMTHQWDAFSKSLAEDSVPRRESLRRMGALFAGVVFSQLGLRTAWGKGPDPCRAFCNRCSKTRQSQCLAACQACNGNTGRLSGSCGSYVCCQTASCQGVCSDLRSDPNCGACGHDCGDIGETCCGSYCADLANDFDNCGRCGAPCDDPGPFEYGACVAGACVYDCVDGAVDCGDGTCTYLGADPNNCGACGNVCPASAPYCDQGVCSESTCTPGLTLCGGACVYMPQDSSNCGACGNICSGATPYCVQGTCTDCGAGRAVCNGVCVNILSDASNCGACGNVCYGGYVCSSGACVDPICQFYDC